MVAYNFKPQFAPDVKSGKKLRTIRQKARAKVGDALQLYTGMMQKNCRKLRDATCTKVTHIKIAENFVTLKNPSSSLLDYTLMGKECDEFAREDGFIDYDAMVRFFKTTYPKKEWPLDMVITEWNPL